MSRENSTLNVHEVPVEKAASIAADLALARCQEEGNVFPTQGSPRPDSETVCFVWGAFKRELVQAYRLGHEAGRRDQTRVCMRSVVARREKE